MKVFLSIQQNGGEYNGSAVVTVKGEPEVSLVNGTTVQIGETIIEFDEYITIKGVRK